VRIAIMAAGAVGGYFGGRMVAAGHDVAFIARGAHGDAIRRSGLKTRSRFRTSMPSWTSSRAPSALGPVMQSTLGLLGLCTH
jgi:2-dehydropantoate 2-reductase